MKSQAIPRTGIIDALATGLNEAARRPWLWVVPFLMDLFLWLAPKLSIAAWTERWMSVWKSTFPLVLTAEQMTLVRESIDSTEKFIVELGNVVNLGVALTAGWLAPPSALVSVQPTRYFMISDAVLAPLSTEFQVSPLDSSPWQGAALQIDSFFGIIVIVALLWLIGNILTALQFRMIAHNLPMEQTALAHGALPASRQPVTENQRRLLDGWLPLAGRFAALSLLGSFVAGFLRVPLGLVSVLVQFSNSNTMNFLYSMTGGVTLWLTMWFLGALFFTGDALAFEHQTLSASLAQSFVLVRDNSMKVLILATVINVLMLGARALWGFIGDSNATALLAIVINSYLATAMVIGIYAYYRDIRRHRQVARASRQVSK